MTVREQIVRMFRTRNVGTMDRVIRAIPAVIVVALWMQGTLSAPIAVGLMVPAAMLLVTSVTGSCSIYYTLGISTRRQEGGTQNER